MLRQFLGNAFVRLVVVVLALAFAVYLFLLRGMYYHPAAEERSAVGHDWGEQGFSVAVVWPPHTDVSLVEGVTLAWEEVNAGGGPLANKIRLRFFTEHDDKGATARAVARVPDVVAVIGHELLGNAIPASATYQENGILFLSPKSTSIRLTAHDFNYVFRLTPDDHVMAQALADFAVEQKWARLGVLYGQHEHGVAASGLFLAEVRTHDVKIPFFRSYLGEADWARQDLRPLLADVRRESFDAIMLADVMPWAGKLLIDMAKMGVTQPILATDKLDSMQVWDVAGTSANNLYVASSVDPESTSPWYVEFKRRFRQRFKVDPGYGSSQGYEAFMLFVNACAASRSADPIAVSTTIRTGKWHGLFGEFAFERNGDVVGRDVTIKRLRDGRFTTVRTIEENVQ